MQEISTTKGLWSGQRMVILMKTKRIVVVAFKDGRQFKEDDIVTIKYEFVKYGKEYEVTGRIVDIDNESLNIDCSAKYKSSIKEIRYDNITSMYEQEDCNDDCLNCAKRTNKTCPKRYGQVSDLKEITPSFLCKHQQSMIAWSKIYRRSYLFQVT